MAGSMVITDTPLIASCPGWLSHSVTFIFCAGGHRQGGFSDSMDGLAAGTIMALLLIFVLALGIEQHRGGRCRPGGVGGVMGFLR